MILWMSSVARADSTTDQAISNLVWDASLLSVALLAVLIGLAILFVEHLKLKNGRGRSLQDMMKEK